MSTVQDFLAKIPGISPSIAGSPVVAFYAQLNRYRAHSSQAPFDLATPTVTPEAAMTAILLLQARLASGLIQIPDQATFAVEMKKLDEALKNPVGFVTGNLTNITQTLAVYGDLIGLPVARVGITKSSLAKSKWPLVLGVLGVAGIAAWGGVKLWQRAKRRLPILDALDGPKLEDVVYETERFWIKRVPKGFEVYEIGPTASKRVAQIGYTGDKGLERAKREIERRESES